MTREKECKSKNLQMDRRYNKKVFWSCTQPTCPERIENCQQHQETNVKEIKGGMNFFRKHNIELVMQAKFMENDRRPRQGVISRSTESMTAVWGSAENLCGQIQEKSN